MSKATPCPHCGSENEAFFSRIEPMGFHCSDCGEDVDSSCEEVRYREELERERDALKEQLDTALMLGKMQERRHERELKQTRELYRFSSVYRGMQAQIDMLRKLLTAAELQNAKQDGKSPETNITNTAMSEEDHPDEYRLLEKGELIKHGDEVYGGYGLWWPVYCADWIKQHVENEGDYRRKVGSELEAPLRGELERERALANRLHAALDTIDFNLAFVNNKGENKEIAKMRSIILPALTAWKEARSE